MTTKTLDLYNIEQKIFWVLSSLIGVVVMLYLYSVISLTLAVVDRNSMNNATHQLANQASELESEYLKQTNSVTLAYAQTLGFHEANAKFARNTEIKLGMAR